MIREARIFGLPVESQRRYRLSINNFTASGGDGYPRLNNHPGYIDSGFNDAEVLRGYINRNSPLKVADYAPGDAVTRR